MTADKSPPLPESEVWWAPKTGTYGALFTTKQMQERDAMWLARLAALTDGAEPVAWQSRHKDFPHAEWSECERDEFMATGEFEGRDDSFDYRALFDHPAPRPSAALVGLVDEWRDNASYEKHGLEWDAGYNQAMSTCADELESALSAVSATPGGETFGHGLTKEPLSIATPAPAESLEAVGLHTTEGQWIPIKPEGAPYWGIHTDDGKTVAGTSSGLSEGDARLICSLHNEHPLRAVSGGRATCKDSLQVESTPAAPALPDGGLHAAVRFAALGIAELVLDQSYFGPHMIGEGDKVAYSSSPPHRRGRKTNDK